MQTYTKQPHSILLLMKCFYLLLRNDGFDGTDNIAKTKIICQKKISTKEVCFHLKINGFIVKTLVSVDLHLK